MRRKVPATSLPPTDALAEFGRLYLMEMDPKGDVKQDAGASRRPDTPYDDIVDPDLLPFTLAEQDTFLKVCPTISH